MAKTASMYIRIDPQLKADVEAIYERFGISLTDAFNVFLHESRNWGGFPFNLRRPWQPQEKAVNPRSALGILHEYANPALIPLEKDAWGMAMEEKYGNP